jgi:hypothetical protein
MYLSRRQLIAFPVQSRPVLYQSTAEILSKPAYENCIKRSKKRNIHGRVSNRKKKKTVLPLPIRPSDDSCAFPLTEVIASQQNRHPFRQNGDANLYTAASSHRWLTGWRRWRRLQILQQFGVSTRHVLFHRTVPRRGLPGNTSDRIGIGTMTWNDRHLGAGLSIR